MNNIIEAGNGTEILVTGLTISIKTNNTNPAFSSELVSVINKEQAIKIINALCKEHNIEAIINCS